MVDSKGDKVLPDPNNLTMGLVIRPLPFKCRFVPRSDAAAEVIINEAERAEVEAMAWN